VVLAEHAGQLVSKNALLDQVWSGMVVEENNLQVQISTLRKVLGAQAIATIPGRGYRLAIAREDVATPALRAGDDPVEASTSVAGLDEASGEPPALYGRAHDVATVRDMIGRHALVTIVGPPGIGKTRLAQAVAHASCSLFTGGIHFAELASLADPHTVLSTVKRALGLELATPGTAPDLWVPAVAGRRHLLVLDNCEHLLDAIDEVVTTLHERAPTVHVLVTSQELLRHADEHIYRLGSLAVPDEFAPLAGASASGAVELFVARVQAVEPGFRLDESNASGVVEICRRLDGIPLAIELAAARTPLLGVEGVRARLDERFRLLTAGSRLALRRHQTLRAALEWSYGLLTEQERSVFDQLGIFAGSFSLEAAQQLATDERADAWTVLDHLGALVDKSLVDVDPGENPRYRMLETTRAFALERLAAGGATSQTMRRHAEVMLDIFSRLRRDVLHRIPPDRGAALLAPDLDNLRAALRWASGTAGDRTIAVALFGAAAGFLQLVAARAEAWSVCHTVRPLVDASIAPAHAARFWCACAEVGAQTAPAAAIGDAGRALAMYRDLGDKQGAYLTGRALALALMQVGRADEARQAVDAFLRLRDPGWAPWVRVWGDNVAALVFAQAGDLDFARRHAAEYLATAQQVDSPQDELVALAILVDLDVAVGDTRQAADAAREALSRYPIARMRFDDGLNLRIFATALMLAGRLDEAEPLYREALPKAKRSFGNAGLVLYDAAALLALRGRLDDAARIYAYAAAVLAQSGRSPRRVARQLEAGLLGRLAVERPPLVVASLFDEGRRLSDDQACELAFPRWATSSRVEGRA
jgi:predicted ATPase